MNCAMISEVDVRSSAVLWSDQGPRSRGHVCAWVFRRSGLQFKNTGYAGSLFLATCKIITVHSL